MENVKLFHKIVDMSMRMENVQVVNGVIISIQMENVNLFHPIVQLQM